MKNILISIFLLFASNVSGQAVHYRIETRKPQQTMEHFSSSDAWSTQFVGLWPQEKQKQMADWLFSMETELNGQPKGIGLSLWRFYVGAGSTEQGENSQIGSVWTRAECFLQADGTYNWNKMKGQRNFMKLAKERGVNKFLAFLNSPPVNFTQNGLATNTGRDGTFNMKPDCYMKYATYLADIIEGVEKHDGIKFNYICPFNEPDGHWNWLGPKQEGTPATNREIAKTVRLISKEFVKRKIDTKILISESSDYRCMFDNHMTDWQRGHQIQTFFSPDSTETYLGNTPNVSRLMVGHSYWTNTPLKNLHDIRCQLRDTLNKYNVDFWQTEYCIMHNDKEIGGIPGFDSTMKTALYVARVIHHDIVFANAKSWQWWRTFGEKNRNALVRIFPDSTLLNGTFADTKLLWAIGNYSRFVRPGAVRLSISAFDKNNRIIPEGDTEQTGLMCSSFQNTDGSKVFVVLNYGKNDRTFILDQDMNSEEIWQQYRTSDRKGENLKPVGKINNGKMVCVPARSIVTLVSSERK